MIQCPSLFDSSQYSVPHPPLLFINNRYLGRHVSFGGPRTVWWDHESLPWPVSVPFLLRQRPDPLFLYITVQLPRPRYWNRSEAIFHQKVQQISLFHRGVYSHCLNLIFLYLRMLEYILLSKDLSDSIRNSSLFDSGIHYRRTYWIQRKIIFEQPTIREQKLFTEAQSFWSSFVAGSLVIIFLRIAWTLTTLIVPASFKFKVNLKLAIILTAYAIMSFLSLPIVVMHCEIIYNIIIYHGIT